MVDRRSGWRDGEKAGQPKNDALKNEVPSEEKSQNISENRQEPVGKRGSASEGAALLQTDLQAGYATVTATAGPGLLSFLLSSLLVLSQHAAACCAW